MDAITVRVFRRPAAQVHGTLFVPAGTEPVAAVLVIGGSGAASPPSRRGARPRGDDRDVGRLLSPPQPARTAPRYPAGALRRALEILRTALPSPHVPMAVIGMSCGSEAAMLTAIHAPDAVQGVVATVPGNMIAGSHPPGGPAWLLTGQPLPYADRQRPQYEDPDALVERVPGPVLLIAAGADQVWPSAAMARALSARLRQHGDSRGHTVLNYPGAGHSLGYLIPRLPPGVLPPGIVNTSPPTR